MRSDSKPRRNNVRSIARLAFLLTTAIALTVFIATAAPQIAFQDSGIFATAAFYPSASRPPGHPIWALYGSVWIKLFPFSNIAWRLAIASATAAALACGTLAAITCRIAFFVLDQPECDQWTPRQENRIVLAASVVAGLGLAFEKPFWGKAVVVDPWSLAMLIFTLSIFYLSRWLCMPESKRALYVAAFFAGLALCENQSLTAAVLAMPILISAGDLKIGRDLFCIQSATLWIVLLARNRLDELGWSISSVWISISFLAAATTVAWAFRWQATGKPFGEFKTVFCCSAMFAVGLSFYFLLPLFSMTDPPFNPGYARTVEGFWHVVTRGQFDSMRPTTNPLRIGAQMFAHTRDLFFDIGAVYVVAALATILMAGHMPPKLRNWVVCLWLFWLVTTLTTIAGLNIEREDLAYLRFLFGPGNVALMILSGIGFTLFATHTKTSQT